jgi:hypothetical protein
MPLGFLRNCTENYQPVQADEVIIFHTNEKPLTLTLPAPQAGLALGYPYKIINAGANPVTIVVAGGLPVINGAASYVLESQYQGVTLISDTQIGGQWYAF